MILRIGHPIPPTKESDFTLGKRTKKPVIMLVLSLYILVGTKSSSADIDLTIHAAARAEEFNLEKELRDAAAYLRENAHGTVNIHINSGTYNLNRPIIINGRDLQIPTQGRIIISGDPKGKTVLTGGVEYTEAANARLGNDKYPRLRRFEGIETAGYEVRGTYVPELRGYFGLYQGEKRLSLAAYPTDGYVTVNSVPPCCSNKTAFTMSRKDAVNVNPDDEPIAGGYYTHQWSYEEIKVERENGVTFIGPKLHDPNQVREAFPVRMLNVTAGLGIPGSYVFSEKAHVILVNPVSDAAIEHSATPNMFIINDTNNLEIRDITVEKTAGTAFVINNSENVTLSSIFIKLSNNGGIEINGGRKVAVTNSAIVDVLGSGIAVRGGDRKELIGSEHSIVNTSITHFGWGAHSYRPAVAVDGVGITVSGCYMSDGPHAAVLLSGNDNSIINNVIYDVLIEADDAGAIYGGKDTTFRGNMMNGNVIVLHNKSDQFVSAIFFDDQLSGSDVKGNVFIGGTVGVYIGGGRDNGVMDNLFVGQSRAAIKIDARGLTWQKEEQSRSPSVKIDTRRGPWLKYRGLQERDTDRPGEPTNNSIADNMYLFTKANEQDAILRCDQPLNASGSCINEKRTGEFHTIQALATLLGGWLGIGIRD